MPDSEFTGYPVPVIRPDNRILSPNTDHFSDFYYSSFQKENVSNNSIVLFYEEKSFSLIIYLYEISYHIESPISIFYMSTSKTVISDLKYPSTRIFVQFEEKKTSDLVNNGRHIRSAILNFSILSAQS